MKYTKEVLAPVVRTNISMAGVLKTLGLKLTGGSQSHLKRLITRYSLDTSHFLGRGANRGIGHKGSPRKLNPKEVLVLKSDNERRTHGYRLRKALIEIGRPEQCAKCSLFEWNGQKLLLVPDHKNGKFWDNRPENLDLLCPNCHSQTKTFAGRNLKIRPSGGMHTQHS